MVTHSCNLNCIYCFERFKSNRMMTFETAKKILISEFHEYEKSYTTGKRLAIELFGGEPLMNFDLIQMVYNWVEEISPKFEYIFQITTNGTLFSPHIKQWLVERKDKIRIVLSVDGTETMQQENRGCDLGSLPMQFVKEVWPNSYFKLTISPESLHNLAQGVIALYDAGYKIAFSLAEGQQWEENADRLYRQELTTICNYFLNNPDKPLEHPLNKIFTEYLDSRISTIVPEKKCGAGTTIGMYDVDGKLYPCHLFLPMVHGNEAVLDDVKHIDFTKKELLIDPKCRLCQAVKVCTTCYGYNYIQRGAVEKRDMGMCRLRLVEAQVISAFQIEYFMRNRDTLNDYDLLSLKSAVKCYQHIINVDL
ncbi:MAG: radical SAM protein [Rikenellaceae bacterium]